MTAKGLNGRSLRVRRRATAFSFVASQQRWKPPMPLIAAMPPSLITSLVRMIASAPRRLVSPSASGSVKTSGPQSLQQTGWAS